MGLVIIVLKYLSGYNCTEGCTHTDHPRYPITVDIAGHMMDTGHTNLLPVKELLPDCRLSVKNVSYNRQLGSKVRRDWKRLILSGISYFI